MFRIREISDDVLPGNRRAIARAQEMLRARLPGIPEQEITDLPLKMRDPVAYKLRAMLFVADDMQGTVKGFALLSHAPDLNFCFLDYIVTAAGLSGSGIGGALYQRTREAARGLSAVGIFLECLPDDPAALSKPELAKTNAARLRFYERFGARPIINTAYETPLTPGGKDLPHLVFDDLGLPHPHLRRDQARPIVRAILERKYADLCPPAYVDAVVASITEDPIRLREPRYFKKPAAALPRTNGKPLEQLIALVVNDKHEIHHVRERGYVEAPVRIKSILDGILPTGLFHKLEPHDYPESHVRAIHDPAFVAYLKAVCAKVEPGKSIYPYVFPIRNAARPPKDMAMRAGYYCIDTFTPLNTNAYIAAKRAVDCSLTAADALLGGQRFAYALVRPPGHHAEHRSFGGFCYFNNAAAAAHYLSAHGPVAILDIDYHHGNGQQVIFYSRADVLTVSIHGHPSFAYPFFTGFAEETGEGPGEGFNLNIPLPESVDGDRFRVALKTALRRIADHKPRFLVVALGLDTAKGDPTGTWTLTGKDFETNARMIRDLNLPTLVVQEGGYRTASLGPNARHFFLGLAGAATNGNGKKQ